MELNIETIFIGAVILIILVIIWVAILRHTFRVKRQMWNQRTTINILIEICKKMGVEYDEAMKDAQRINNSD